MTAPMAPTTPTAPTATTPTTRHRRQWIALVAVVALIAAFVCWRQLRDGRAEARPGQTVPATSPLAGPTTLRTLRLPDGEYDIRSTPPLDDVPDDPSARALQAPDDGSFVGLQITRNDTPAVARWSFRSVSNRERTQRKLFTLVADGRRYPVTTFDAYDREVDDDEDDYGPYGRPFVPQRVYVGVSGAAKQLQLEVTFAGRKQLLDLRTGDRRPGEFAPLYANSPVDLACGTPTWTPRWGSASNDCRVDLAQRTPYYPGFGWAPAGKQWATLGTGNAKSGGLRYQDGSRVARYENYGLPDVAVTLNGVAAQETGLFSNVFGSTRRDVSLFLVDAEREGDASTVGITVTYKNVNKRSDSKIDGVPLSPTVTASWKVQLP